MVCICIIYLYYSTCTEDWQLYFFMVKGRIVSRLRMRERHLFKREKNKIRHFSLLIGFPLAHSFPSISLIAGFSAKRIRSFRYENYQVLYIMRMLSGKYIVLGFLLDFNYQLRSLKYTERKSIGAET